MSYFAHDWNPDWNASNLAGVAWFTPQVSNFHRLQTINFKLWNERLSGVASEFNEFNRNRI
jgi:hypothetical protein